MNTLEHNEETKTAKEKTDSGLDENLAGMLCYLFGVITGVVFILIEKKNRFVRFHALQSIFLSIVVIILNTAFNMIPFLGFMFSILLTPVVLILWIVLMVNAYQGKIFKLPIIGDMVEKQLK